MAATVNKNSGLARFSQKPMTSLHTEQRHRSRFHRQKHPCQTRHGWHAACTRLGHDHTVPRR